MLDLIDLDSPAVANVTVTSRELVVRGTIEGSATRMRVTLEARGNRVIDEASVTAGLAAGGAGGTAPFEVRFGLPNPRPNGRMIVQVAAYDRDGRVVDVVRRPIRVGPLMDGPAG